MDLENEKIGPAYKAPDSYFKESESRLMQRLGIDMSQLSGATVSEAKVAVPVAQPVSVPLDTTGVQKRARKQDPITSKSVGINKDLDELGNVEIAPLTFTTNENPEWVNFGAIPEVESALETPLDQQIKKVSYGDLLNQPSAENPVAETPLVASPIAENVVVNGHGVEIPAVDTTPITLEFLTNSTETPVAPVEITASIEIESTIESTTELVETASELVTSQPVVELTDVPVVTEPVVIHAVPESVGLDELESYITVNQPTPTPAKLDVAPAAVSQESAAPKMVEEKPISLEAPATAFAPIAGRQKETATPGWLGVAAALAAIVAAYFIWTAIQPPKLDQEEVVLQQDEATVPETPLDEPAQTDTIPDGLQLVEPLIMEAMPKYKEPNVYTIIDAAEMPEKTKRALQDLEDHGLATFDMEDELFEELDLESL
ncbi:MAG: hypothetical protein RLZZ512_1599 [Bacteroidota bacterium]|jgi:hypothetical protein